VIQNIKIKAEKAHMCIIQLQDNHQASAYYTDKIFTFREQSKLLPAFDPNENNIKTRILYFSCMVLMLAFSAYAFISGKTFLFKAVVYNFANIDDYKKFSNNTVVIGKPQPWQVSAGYNKTVFPR
jgi:hypothetical protein